jgi:hypothetical protein
MKKKSSKIRKSNKKTRKKKKEKKENEEKEKMKKENKEEENGRKTFFSKFDHTLPTKRACERAWVDFFVHSRAPKTISNWGEWSFVTRTIVSNAAMNETVGLTLGCIHSIQYSDEHEKF